MQLTSPPLQPGESTVLDIERGAVLAITDVPDGSGVPPRLRAELAFRAQSASTRTVPALSVEEVLRQSQVVVDGTIRVGKDDNERMWAWPAHLILTDRRLLAIGTDDRLWSWSFDEIEEIVNSATEPCTVVRGAAGDRLGILLPLDQADAFREALDTRMVAFEHAKGDSSTADQSTDGSKPGDAESTTLHAGETGPPPDRRRISAIPTKGDRVFRSGSWLGGLSVLAIMALVGLFLSLQATTALKATGLKFLTTSEWQPDTHHFGIAAVLTLTVFIALVALAVAIPLAVGTSLFISEVSPRRLKQTFVSMVDLMAAVPSIVYGLWGLFFLQGHVIGLSRWISTWFSWIPIFRVDGADPTNPLASKTVYTASTFIAGLVVALMVVPISCSIMREVFSQAPAGEREGAYALGATRWGMIRSVVLPFGKGGMIGAVMLGLGRALGETIAVYMIISPVFRINWHILQTGSNSVSSLIVLRTGDASGFGRSALMAAGLSLFAVTLVVNFTASAVVARSRSGAESDA